MKKYILAAFIILLLGCNKEEEVKQLSISELEQSVRGNQDKRAVFTFKQYEKLLTLLQDDKYIVLPLNKFKDSINDNKVFIGLRHDVDCHPFKAVEMAKLESEYEISSTYYILATSNYYGVFTDKGMTRYKCMEGVYKNLHNLGHEIGVHNDMLVVMIEKEIDPYAFNKDEIEHYKSLGITVNGTAAHGSSLASITLPNYNMFSDIAETTTLNYNGNSYDIGKYSLKQCGYEYEAYFINNNKYYSECGGNWLNVNSFEELLVKIENSVAGDRIQLLVHPVWWGK